MEGGGLGKGVDLQGRIRLRKNNKEIKVNKKMIIEMVMEQKEDKWRS